MIAPPNPVLLNAISPPQGSGGFELYRGTTFLYALPLTLKPGTVGGELQLTLDRAPFSSVPFGLGDGLPAPEFISLSGFAAWNDYVSATTQKSLMRQAARLADRLVYQNVLYSLLRPGTGDARFTDRDHDLQTDISLRLVPAVLVTPEGIAERANYLYGVMAVTAQGGGAATVQAAPGAMRTPGTFVLQGAGGASFAFESQTFDYQEPT